jgi:hypothetical protein
VNAATALFREALRVCGGPVELTGPGGVRAVTASIQPASAGVSGPDTDRPAPPGWVSRTRYLYLGPPDEPLTGVKQLRHGGRAYNVLRAEIWYLGETPHHTWALLEPVPD